MEKPIATIRLTKIAWILIAACLGLQILMTVLSSPLEMLVYHHDEPQQLSAGVVTMAMILYLLEVPLLVYAVWQSRQTSVTHQSAVNSAILLPVCYFGRSVLGYPIVLFVGNHMLGNEAIFQYSRLMHLVKPVFYLCTAAFVLLACACAIEYQMTAPKREATRPLTMFAMIGSLGYLAVRFVCILFYEQISSLIYHYELTFPMKWKLVLLAFVAATCVPTVILAMKSHFSQTSALTKIIATPILFYGISGICTLIRRFILSRFMNAEGVDTVAAFAQADSFGNILPVVLFAAVVCLICAGAMEYHQNKIAPSDGESSNL